MDATRVIVSRLQTQALLCGNRRTDPTRADPVTTADHDSGSGSTEVPKNPPLGASRGNRAIQFRDSLKNSPPIVIVGVVLVVLAAIATLITSVGTIKSSIESTFFANAVLANKLSSLSTGVQISIFSSNLGPANARTTRGTYREYIFKADKCTVQALTDSQDQVFGFTITVTDSDFRPAVSAAGFEGDPEDRNMIQLGVSSMTELRTAPLSVGGRLSNTDTYYAELHRALEHGNASGLLVLVATSDRGYIPPEYLQRLGSSRDGFRTIAESDDNADLSSFFGQRREEFVINTIGYLDLSVLPGVSSEIGASPASILTSAGTLLGDYRVGPSRDQPASQPSSALDLYGQLSQLSVDVSSDYFDSVLGAPTMTRHSGNHTADVYNNPYCYVLAISNDEQGVLVYTVTTKSKDFRPPVPYLGSDYAGDPNSVPLMLGLDTFADFAYNPTPFLDQGAAAGGWNNGRWELYMELHYLGGALAYQSVFLAFSDAGYDFRTTRDLERALQLDPPLPAADGTLDAEEDGVANYREYTTINAYGVSSRNSLVDLLALELGLFPFTDYWTVKLP